MRFWVTRLLFFIVLLHAQPVFAAAAGFEEKMRLGGVLLEQGQLEKALAPFEEASRLEPGDSQPVIQRARILYRLHRYREAQAAFETARTLGKDHMTGKFLSAALESIRVHQPVLDQIETLYRQNPSSVQQAALLHRKAAVSMARQGTPWWLLLPHLEAWQKAESSNQELLELIARGAYEAQDFSMALKAYESLTRLQPTRENFERAGEVAVSSARWSDARHFYKKALREAVRSGAKEEVNRFRKRLTELPIDPSVILRLMAEERYEESFKRLKKYLNFNPSDVWAMSLLGVVYEAIGQDSRAERLYREAVSIRPEHPTPHYYYGQYLLLRKKKYEEALNELKKFRECLGSDFAAGSDEERRALERDRIQATRWIASILDTTLGRPEEAFREIASLIRFAPDDAEIRYDYGILAARLGRKQTAYSAFQKVIKLAPGKEIARRAQEAIHVIQNTDSRGNIYADPYS